MSNELLTKTEVSMEMRVSLPVVGAWIDAGELDAFDARKPGSDQAMWRIPREALEKFKASRSNQRPAKKKVMVRREIPNLV